MKEVRVRRRGRDRVDDSGARVEIEKETPKAAAKAYLESAELIG